MRPTFPGEIFPEKVERPRGPEKVMARRGDPQTSWAAAASVSRPGIHVLYWAITALLRSGPLTDEAILFELRSRHVQVTPSGARTRRAELVAMGRVRDSGKRGRLSTGRQAIIWEVVP